MAQFKKYYEVKYILPIYFIIYMYIWDNSVEHKPHIISF